VAWPPGAPVSTLPAVAETDRERAQALAKRVTVGVVTALPEECAAMLAMLDRPVQWTAAGRGAGRVYDLGEIPAHGGGRHVVALALADMGNNIAAARGTLLLKLQSHNVKQGFVLAAGNFTDPARQQAKLFIPTNVEIVLIDGSNVVDFLDGLSPVGDFLNDLHRRQILRAM
jgi:hypothetical protein